MAENGRWDHESGVGFVVSCGALWKGGRGEVSFVWFFAWAAGGGVVETQSGKAIFCLIVFVCFFIGFNQDRKAGAPGPAECLAVRKDLGW